MLPPSCQSLLALAASLVLAGSGLTAQAQPDLRSTFPGRRVGGGTRGECSSRLIAHLVPANSVYAPGSSRTLAILEGPIANPRPIQVNFRSEGSANPVIARTLTLPAAGVGIVLFPQPDAPLPLRWESTYQCESAAPAATDDPLSFVSSASPPAVSLLLRDGGDDDRRMQQSVQKLSQSCGGSVPVQVVAQSFGLADAIGSDWPSQLPVRCVR